MNAIVKDTIGWLSAVKKPLTTEQTLEQIPNVKNWLEEELREFEDALRSGDRPGMRNAVVDAMWILNNLSFFVGLTPEEIAAEGELVRLSNYSKFCKTEEEAQQSCYMYSKGTHPNKIGENIITSYHETGNKEYPYVILKEDGKIFKSHNFKDVNQFRVEDVTHTIITTGEDLHQIVQG